MSCMSRVVRINKCIYSLTHKLIMSVRWFSQVGQDRLVHSLSVPGVFVDLAANDPYENSNTAALEMLGWKGICIDPTLRSKELFLKSNRTCTFVNAVIGSKNETVLFRDISPIRQTRHSWMFGLSGVVSSRSSKTCWGKRYCISPLELSKRGLRVHHRVMSVQTLDSIMNSYHIKKIDYLSLDVEGYEFQVLSGYSSSPRLLSIENPNSHCKRALKKRNMLFFRSLGNFGEEFWISKEVTSPLIFGDKGQIPL